MQKKHLVVLAVVLVLSALSLSLAEQSIVSAEGAQSGVRTGGDPVVQGGTVTVITFEGIANRAPVGTIDTVTFLGGWKGLVDSDAGGTAGIANEPSGDTAAFIEIGSPDVIFATPVGSVSFMYGLDTNAGTANVTFRDASGAVLGTRTMDVCGSIHCGNTCVGDPTGALCAWTPISFTVSSQPGISSLNINGGNGWWVIDDFTYDTNVVPVELQSFTVE